MLLSKQTSERIKACHLGGSIFYVKKVIQARLQAA